MLFVHNGNDWIRGSEQCLVDLAANLDPSRYHGVAVCNAPTLARALADRGVDVELVAGWEEQGHHMWPLRDRAREMRGIIDRVNPAVVHVNTLEPLKLVLLAARSRRCPVIAHLHLPSPAHERLYVWLHQVSMAVGVSHAVLQGLVEDGMPQERLRVIHNGVDEARLVAGDARSLREELGISREAQVFTAVASLIRRKGVDVLLRAMPSVLAQEPGARLLVVGSGEEEASLRELAIRLGIGGTVHFTGEQQNVGAILRDAADALVTASRAEAFPLNVLEGALFGLPVIASDIAPHREALEHGVTGVIFPVDDAEALASAMLRVMHDRAEAARLGAAAEQLVRSRFMLSHYVEAFEALYDELLGRPRKTFSWVGGSHWPPAYTRWARHVVGKRLGFAGVPELMEG